MSFIADIKHLFCRYFFSQLNADSWSSPYKQISLTHIWWGRPAETHGRSLQNKISTMNSLDPSFLPRTFFLFKTRTYFSIHACSLTQKTGLSLCMPSRKNHDGRTCLPAVKQTQTWVAIWNLLLVLLLRLGWRFCLSSRLLLPHLWEATIWTN